MDRQAHWQRIYTTKDEGDVSWFEPVPAFSMRLMESAGLTRETCVVDIGGGESRLVDELVGRGLTCVAILDVSSAALERARARLGDAANVPVWIAADVTSDWSLKPMDIWHDRAVFHFLTDTADRACYLRHLRETVKPNGAAIIATFALDGPEKCSGLPVTRYSPETLARELGGAFRLIESVHHMHRTPWDAAQSFQYSRFARAH
jgi:SAM-dependent methyltransferase